MVAEYAVKHGLDQLPGFKWWVKYTLRKAKRFIQKTKVYTVKRTEKYGVKILRTVEEAYELDRSTSTDYWSKAIAKEMEATKVAFDILPPNKRPNPGYKFIKCHLIFDVKCDLTRKARFVAGGHMTSCAPELTYSTVVSRDSIRILLMVASLNELKVMSTDIMNAFLHALPREKVYFVAGSEFGALKGRNVVIVRALYALKSSGAIAVFKVGTDENLSGLLTKNLNGLYLYLNGI